MSRASRSDGAGQNDKNLINHMQMQRRKKLRGGRAWAVLLFCACLLSGGALWTSCDDRQATSVASGQYIPKTPDYADSTMWYVERNDTAGTGADVFYIVSTWEKDWTTADGALCHYADVYNAAHRADMATEISRIAGYMGEGNDFYSPYYRHMTIEVWATQSEDSVDKYVALAMDDVRAAFREFQRRRDPERPFVLAGFSQGGRAVVELLKSMPADLHRYLVAAYVMGYKVTPDDVAATTNIRAAQDSVDTGVTICYNSVADVQYIKPIVSVPCAMCINPVNWHTDATPAVLDDTVTVSVDPAHHVLVVKGYSGAEYHPIYGFLNIGDFHSAEPWLYRESLRRNIQARIRAYRQAH